MSDDERQGPKTNALAQLRVALKAESGDGLSMLQDITNNPVCTVTVIESIPCVAVVWMRYATSLQLQFVHENIIFLLKKFRLSKILGDDTALPTIHPKDRNWIIENWMPRAIQAGLRIIAQKSPVPYFGKLSVDFIRSAAPRDLVIQSFDDKNAAQQWLKNWREKNAAEN